MPLTLQDLKLEILKLFAAAPRGGNKFNLLGRPYQTGGLEASLRITFDKEQRAMAAQAFEHLKKDGLIRSTLSDLVDPENWCEITNAGRQALESGGLDDLDSVLLSINPHLVEIRRGAWSALASNQPDSLRQAAHSGRELIDQTLKEGVLDSEIKAWPGFTPDTTSKSGVTRRMRLRLLMQKRKGSVSDSDLAIVEKSCDLVEAVDNKLMAQSHARAAPSPSDVKDALHTAETALRRILL
jgi:hypothetical protein